jgi:2-dehydro-3-deoxygluconokinase
MPRFVAIGECMLELSSGDDGRWRMGMGGDTFNTVAHLARLGADVGYLTSIGDDPFSRDMKERWAERGIDVSLVATVPGALPGLYAIRTDDAGERSFFYWRENAAVRRLFALPTTAAALARAAEAELLYLSGITLSLFEADGRSRLAELAAAVRANGGTVAFDTNYRAKGWRDPDDARRAVEAFAGQVTTALPTFDDEHTLFGDPDPQATISRWLSFGASEVVVKLGRSGCLVSDSGGATSVVEPVAPVTPIDTTGAGDAFNAAYLFARDRGASQVSAAAEANLLAGRVIRYRGAIDEV